MVRSTGHLLLVDDQPGQLELLVTLLEEKGNKVTTATNVGEAISRLNESTDAIDLIISDVRMPGESGFDLLKWIKDETHGFSETPVLLITSELPEPEHRIHGLSLGAVDYLVKSIDIDEMVIRISHALENANKIKVLKNSLEDSEKIALTGRIFAASNHEIKNLANLIKVTSDQLIDRLIEREKIDTQSIEAKALKALHSSANMLVDVLRNIGRFLSPHGWHMTPVYLPTLIDEILFMLQPKTKGLLVNFDKTYISDESELWVSGHVTLIKQVMVNLILNATEAIQELGPAAGGRITLTISNEHAKALRIQVKDNGIGLKAKESRVDFQPFTSTKQLRGGQGLGLWLCSRIAEMMKGSLSLQSEGAGKGAIATLVLPRTPPPKKEFDLDIASYLEAAEREGIRA